MNKMVIDTPYYEDMSRYSNSDIGYFLKNDEGTLCEGDRPRPSFPAGRGWR